MAENRKKGKLNAKRLTQTLRNMDMGQLQKELAEQQEKLMRDRFRHATATLEDTAGLKTLRRQIARIQTVMNEKQRGEKA